MARLLVVDGSVRGGAGNTARALAYAASAAARRGMSVGTLTMCEHTGSVEDVVQAIRAADAFVFGTGTYWGSWGSPLQRLLEVITGLEASDALVGKPCGVVVTMDSVGGVDVAARLLGALCTMGCAAAPFPIVVLSRIGAQVQDDDVWRLVDVDVLVENLAIAAAPRPRYAAWTVERARLPTGPFPTWGPLDVGGARFAGPTTKASDDG